MLLFRSYILFSKLWLRNPLIYQTIQQPAILHYIFRFLLTYVLYRFSNYKRVISYQCSNTTKGRKVTETEVQIFINIGQGVFGKFLLCWWTPLNNVALLVRRFILCPIVQCQIAEVCPFDPKLSLLSWLPCCAPIPRRKLHLVTLTLSQNMLHLGG